MNDLSERAKIEQAISALEAQRSVLGDAVVEIALAPLRHKLAELASAGPSTQLPFHMHEQRKLVTVLFSDLVGYTALSEKLDPEDISEILKQYFHLWSLLIEAHGGVVEKFIGDAVVAVFGFPAGQEDDAEQAIRTALDMQVELSKLNVKLESQRGLHLSMRIGINTGLVLVEIREGDEKNWSLLGDTVNTASRLQSQAPTNGILISHDTFRHVRGIFSIEPQPPLIVKGKAEPLHTYVVLRARPRALRIGTRGVQGIETNMVGRVDELRQLQEAFYQVFEQGRLQIKIVIGEAGIGKSRLLHEFAQWIDLRRERVWYLRDRASQETQYVPYAILRDLFAFRFEIQDSDSAEAVRLKLERGLASVETEIQASLVKRSAAEAGVQSMPARGAYASTRSAPIFAMARMVDGLAIADPPVALRVAFIGQLLGFDFSSSAYLKDVLGDARQIRDRALVYLADFLCSLAQVDPVLITLEDLHWIDDSSLEVLNRLALILRDQPILITCATRPSLFEREPDLRNRIDLYTPVQLSPLSPADSLTLVDEILRKVIGVPSYLREMIARQAEGNPYYVEELIKMLMDDEVILVEGDLWQIDLSRLKDLRVPPTLTAVLQARVDSLNPRDRAILQRASVIGRIFWDKAIAALSEDLPAGCNLGEIEISKDLQASLDTLRRQEMIFRRELTSFSGAQEYIFKHALLREVTYESLLKRVRKNYHGCAAEWLIQQSGDRVDEFAGLVAYHLELAGETAKAIGYLDRAGQRAVALYASSEAVQYFSRGLQLTPQTEPTRRYELLAGREKAYDLLGQRDLQQQDVLVLEQLADSLADPCKKAEAALRHSNYANTISDYPASIAAAQAAISAACHADQSLEAEGHRYLGVALWQQGSYIEARPEFEQAIRLASQTCSLSVEADSLRGLGNVICDLGDRPKSLEYYQQALQLYRQVGNRRGECIALNNLGVVTSDLGDLAAAVTFLEQSLLAVREMGDRRTESGVVNNLGTVCSDQGDLAGARKYYEQSLRIDQEIGDRQGESLALSNLGLITHQAGDQQAALHYCRQAVSLAWQVGARRNQGYALTNLGHALAGMGNQEEAAQAYAEALEIRRTIGELNWASEDLAGLARLALQQGQAGQAVGYVEEILSFLQSGSLDGAIEPLRVYLTCFQVLSAQGDGRAFSQLETAHRLLQERAARISDGSMRQAFLHTLATHHQIEVLWSEANPGN